MLLSVLLLALRSVRRNLLLALWLLLRRSVAVAHLPEHNSVLVTIDYPDGVTGGLRRTTDALRAVLERTRADLTTTVVATRLQAAIEAATAR